MSYVHLERGVVRSLRVGVPWGTRMYIIMWEFKVKPEMIRPFTSAYKADGDWTQLFRLADGYIRAELLSWNDDEGRFVLPPAQSREALSRQLSS